MSLLQQMQQEFVALNKTKVDTEYGEVVSWEEGKKFIACCTFQSQGNISIGQKNINKPSWLITVLSDYELQQYDVIKRVKDGKTLKIDTPTSNIQTPVVATFKFKQAYAYDYDISIEEQEGEENG